MLGNILGIDINNSSVSGVLVRCGLQKDLIVSCASVPVSGDGGAADAVDKLIEKMKIADVVCVTGVPADQVSFRNLVMPFEDKKSIRQTLIFELETMLPYGVDEITADFIVARPATGKTDVLAASVERSWIAERLAFLQQRGLDPELIDVRNVPIVTWLLKQKEVPADGLFLEIRRKKCTMILFSERRIVLVRSLYLNRDDNKAESSEPDTLNESVLGSLCNGIEKTLVALRHESGLQCAPQKVFITGPSTDDPAVAQSLSRFLGMEAETVDLCRGGRVLKEEGVAGQWNPALMNNALALALRDNKQPGFNFRRDGFAVKKQFARFKKEIVTGVVYGVILLVLLAVDAAVDYSHLDKRMNDLDNRIKEIFSQTFPDVKRVVNPVQQMRIKINEMKKGSSVMPAIASNQKVLDLMEDISRRIPETLELQVSRMVIDQEMVLLKGKTDTFNTVDSIKKELEASSYYSEVTIASANLDRSGEGVQFELKLSRAGREQD
jgi:general secretion pathway protein L